MRRGPAPAAPEFTLPVGATARLVPADADAAFVAWSIAPEVGTPADGVRLDDAGLLSADAPGRYLVLGRRGGDRGVAYVTVLAATDASGGTPADFPVPLTKSSIIELTLDQFWIDVTPSTASVAPGATVQLRAMGHSEDGSHWTIRPVWEPQQGTVTESGLYTAPATPGTYRVVVTRYGDIQTDTATVRVGSGTTTGATGSDTTGSTTGGTTSGGSTTGDTASGGTTSGGTTTTPLPPPVDGTAPPPFTHAPSGGNWVTVRNSAMGQLPYRSGYEADNGSGMSYYIASDLANVRVRSDGSGEPVSSPSALRTTIPAGWTGGGGSMSRWEMRGFPANDGRLYVGYTLRPSANWWHPAVNTGWKNFYLRPAGSDRNSIHFLAWVDAGSHGQGTMLPKLGTQWGGKASDEAWVNEEYAKRIRPGEWNVVELLITPNTNGAYDGSLQVWVNGQSLPMTHSVRGGGGINWFLAGQPVGWDGLWFDMIYAHPGAIPPAEQWLEHGHVVVKVSAR